MTEKFLDLVRRILIKIVIPYRRKKKELLSKFRFSITFRIALNYIRLFIVNSLLVVVAFIFVFIAVCERNNLYKMDDIMVKLTQQEDLSQMDVNRLYYDKNIEMRIKDSNDTIVFSNVINAQFDNKNWFNLLHYHKVNDESTFLFFDTRQLERKDGEYTVEFQLDFSREFTVFSETFMWMLPIILVLTLVIMKSGKRQITGILRPIEEMSVTAERLNVNTLSNARLNVEGTKNELKDLAATINDMLDRLELSYESQKQFVSDASHELRTPIAVIQGYINMLDRWGKEDKDVMEESVEAIKQEAMSMKDLVEKLLFLSRNDKKTLKLEKSVFNAGDVVEEMLKETSLTTQNREIVTDGIETCDIYADKQAIKQAVRVFISNAVKYSNDGDRICISCKRVKNECCISVEDSGLGMKKKDIENIFHRFYRADDVRNRNIQGHGLGLSIAKLIVQKHVGRIEIKSKYGKGSRFTICIPVCK